MKNYRGLDLKNGIWVEMKFSSKKEAYHHNPQLSYITEVK